MKKIKDLRKEREISQRELATSLNVTQATVSRWELPHNRYCCRESETLRIRDNKEDIK